MITRKITNYEFTEEQMDLIAHFLGINYAECLVKNSAAGQKITRNYFNTDKNSREYHQFQDFIQLRLMRHRPSWDGKSIFFHLEVNGAIAFIKQFNKTFPDSTIKNYHFQIR